MILKPSKAPLDQPTGLQAMEKRELEESFAPRRIEENPAQGEQLYRQMVENARDVIFRMSMQTGKYEYVSPAIVDLTGYSAGQILDNPALVARIIHPEWRDFFKSAKEKAMTEGFIPSSLEYQVVHRSGQVKWVSQQNVLTLEPDGRPLALYAILRDATRQVEAEEGLRRAHDELERQVERRTAELVKANERLRLEIKDRRQTERLLRQREQELEVKTARLEETNIAMRVLLKRRHDDKGDVEQSVLYNIKELIEPYLKKMREGNLDVHKTIYLNILEANLKNIASPFVRGLSSRYLKFTPVEIQVANLIKQGKTTKATAQMMNLSERTIESHRSSIRRKLGIHKQKANLRTHLLSLA